MIALSNVFRVILIVSVARTSLSLGDNWVFVVAVDVFDDTSVAFFEPAFAGVFFLFAALFDTTRVGSEVVVLEDRFEGSWINRELRIVTVPDEQVAGEVNAARTASTFACKEVMLNVDDPKVRKVTEC